MKIDQLDAYPFKFVLKYGTWVYKLHSKGQRLLFRFHVILSILLDVSATKFYLSILYVLCIRFTDVEE